MSTQRTGWHPWWGKGARPTNEGGVRLCKMCPRPIETGRRREYCSETCHDQYYFQTSPAFARLRVKRRDHGVCSACGVDTDALGNDYRAALRVDQESTKLCGRCTAELPNLASCAACGAENPGFWRHHDPPFVAREPIVQRAVAAGFKRSEFIERARWRRALWEADHITPVSEGGGMCGLDNLRTLCLPCHRKETAALAARNASRRRSESNARRTEGGNR